MAAYNLVPAMEEHLKRPPHTIHCHCDAKLGCACCSRNVAAYLQVFEPASESHLLLLSESAVRADEASRAGVAAQTPEQTQELRVQQFVRVRCGQCYIPYAR